MTSRRSFIKTSSALTAGLMIAPSLFNYKNSYIGLQLYTVRDAMQKDPAGTLAKVASIGFNSVENATYTGTQNFYGMDAKTHANIMKDKGLVNFIGDYSIGDDANV